MNRNNYRGYHIMTDTYSFDTDTWKTGFNNNVLVFGPSGSGKTRHYVKPNILTSNESMIISDTKGSLYDETKDVLISKGFKVYNIDFTNLKKGMGYNPLAYIHYDAEDDKYSEKDILSLSNLLVAKSHKDDPFWDDASKQYLKCLISYVLEALPKKEHTLDNVLYYLPKITTDDFSVLLEELEVLNPNSTTILLYNAISNNKNVSKTDACVKATLSTHLDTLCLDDAKDLYRKTDQIDFSALGEEKTAVFLTVSDTDRSMDKLANAFMTQALQTLCKKADNSPGHRLPVPVRFYLDDFATNLYIPNFDKTVSVIRSREISVSVILQSITQLESLYGIPAAKTIINNCDRQLYLGGQDIDTATYISKRINKPLEKVLLMPQNKLWFISRCNEAILSDKYDIRNTEHLTKNHYFANRDLDFDLLSEPDNLFDTNDP